jgi:hypothetical protein
MKKLRMPQGISDFRELREGGFYYVDKTHIIPEMMDASAKVLLLPRPRRFGKTLNMTTLQTWYERLPTGETYTHLLDGLKADKMPGDHHDRRGKLPVVFLTFKDIKEANWPDTLQKIEQTVRAEAIRLSPWWANAGLDPQIVRDLDSLCAGTAEYALLSSALEHITKALLQSSGEHPLVLIDEYDTPIHAGVENGFFNEAVSFFRNFLSAGLKDNSFIWKGVLTGILRVSKENLFSGLNNPTVCALTSIDFSTCFGLLESEVEQVLADFNLSNKMDEVRAWYNGYRFGDTMIYNPWSVINFVSRPHDGCQPYWVNTASNRILGEAIADADGILQQELEYLLSGEAVEKIIDPNVSYHVGGVRPADVWSFLLYTGYLTPIAMPKTDEWGAIVAKLKIPNKEVFLAYKKLITEWTQSKIGADKNVLAMLEALVTGDEDFFAEEFSTLVENVLSSHDVSSRASESFYHAFVTGMLVFLTPTHHVRSNRESGRGRYDVMVEPHNTARYPGVVIEFKVATKNVSLEEALETAHQQIVDKNYEAELRAKGCTSVLRWAIAFKGKEVALSLRGDHCEP